MTANAKTVSARELEAVDVRTPEGTQAFNRMVAEALGYHVVSTLTDDGLYRLVRPDRSFASFGVPESEVWMFVPDFANYLETPFSLVADDMSVDIRHTPAESLPYRVIIDGFASKSGYGRTRASALTVAALLAKGVITDDRE